MSFATVLAAPNSEPAHNSTSTGITYIAMCRPDARNAVVISLAPAASIADSAMRSLNVPMMVGPKLAPST